MPRKKPAVGGDIVLTRPEAIAAMCLQCLGMEAHEIPYCTADGKSGLYPKCPLYDIRPMAPPVALKRRLSNAKGFFKKGDFFSVKGPPALGVSRGRKTGSPEG